MNVDLKVVKMVIDKQKQKIQMFVKYIYRKHGFIDFWENRDKTGMNLHILTEEEALKLVDEFWLNT